MIESQDLYKQGKEAYLLLIQENADYNKYQVYARDADLITEECLRRMSEGTDAVNKSALYPYVFGIVFEDMVKKAK